MTSRSDGGFRVDIEAVPASRPRVTRWGTYYTARYKEFLETLRKRIEDVDAPPQSNSVTIFLTFVIRRPKNPAHSYPRGDLDNYAKGVLDCLVKGCKIIHDDSQIIALHLRKAYALPTIDPHILIEWEYHE